MIETYLERIFLFSSSTIHPSFSQQVTSTSSSNQKNPLPNFCHPPIWWCFPSHPKTNSHSPSVDYTSEFRPVQPEVELDRVPGSSFGVPLDFERIFAGRFAVRKIIGAIYWSKREKNMGSKCKVTNALYLMFFDFYWWSQLFCPILIVTMLPFPGS